MANTSDMARTAEWLNRQAVDARLDAIAELKQETKFCWECGFDFGNSERVCHCTNDE